MTPSEPFDADDEPDWDADRTERHGFNPNGRALPFWPPSQTPAEHFDADESHPCCPQCMSLQIEPRHLARRIGAVVGVVAGATNGVVRALQAAEIISTGVKLGLAAGLSTTGAPLVGILASALAAALLEGTAGCALGSRFGDAVDRMILPCYCCLSCGHTFSAPVDSAS